MQNKVKQFPHQTLTQKQIQEAKSQLQKSLGKHPLILKNNFQKLFLSQQSHHSEDTLINDQQLQQYNKRTKQTSKISQQLQITFFNNDAHASSDTE